MNLLRKEISRGGAIPRGWCLAWYEPRRRVGVYYPAPLHWVARTLLEIAAGSAWRYRPRESSTRN